MGPTATAPHLDSTESDHSRDESEMARWGNRRHHALAVKQEAGMANSLAKRVIVQVSKIGRSLNLSKDGLHEIKTHFRPIGRFSD